MIVLGNTCAGPGSKALGQNSMTSNALVDSYSLCSAQNINSIQVPEYNTSTL